MNAHITCKGESSLKFKGVLVSVVFSSQVVVLQMKYCTWCQIKKTSGSR